MGLSAICSALRDSAASLRRITDADLLLFSALVLFGGAVWDRLGRNRAFAPGVRLFAVASARGA